jgi:hypothetical protein
MQMSAAGHAGADQAASLAQKAVAVVATVAVVGGGGMAVKNGGIRDSLSKITGTAKSEAKADAVRADGLPADPRKAAEVLYGGQGRGNLPGGGKLVPLVVPAPMVNALPQAPVGGDANGPPGQPPTIPGEGSPAPDGAAVTPGSSDSSPAAGAPDLIDPVVGPVTSDPQATDPPGNGNGNANGQGSGNGNGNGKAKGHDKKNDSAPDSGGSTVTDPAAGPLSATDGGDAAGGAAAPILDSSGNPVEQAILDAAKAGSSDHIPPGQLKKITGAKKPKS